MRWLLVFWLLAGMLWAQGAGTADPAYGYLTLQNDSTTGTFLNGPVKTGVSPLQVVGTSAGDQDARGICILNCGKTGLALISLLGFVNCTFDGSVTAQDWVQISTTKAHQCHDAGANRPTHGKLLGVVTTSATGPGNYEIAQSDVGAVGAVETDASTGLINISLLPAGVIAFPSGAIVMTKLAACWSGFTKDAGLNLPGHPNVIFCSKN